MGINEIEIGFRGRDVAGEGVNHEIQRTKN